MLLETSAENLAEFKRDELKAHQDLLHVIKQRDPEMSRKAMIDHITDSETLIVGCLEARRRSGTRSPRCGQRGRLSWSLRITR
jgi:DNA-binding FadR family transcriptional regulator